MTRSDASARRARVDAALAEVGLAIVGGFLATPEDDSPENRRSLALIGFAGPEAWPHFTQSAEAQDGLAHPLDRWSRRVGDAMASRLDAVAAYPFGGPPYAPFLKWAARAGGVWPSELGMSIHHRRGLWISFRFGLAFSKEIALDPTPQDTRPCDACADKPCLSACPVGAFANGNYDAAACVRHLRSPEGAPCRDAGCQARHACPVGRDLRPTPNQAAHHMAAFVAAFLPAEADGT